MIISKKHLVYIISTISLATVLIFLLAWISLEPLKKNGFNRRFGNNYKINPLFEAMKDDKIIGLGSLTSSNIFLKTNDPKVIGQMNNQFKNYKEIYLNIPNNPEIATAFNTLIDSPYVSILAPNARQLITVTLNNGTSKTNDLPGVFTKIAPISKDTYILRGFTTNGTKGQTFLKINTSTNKIESNDSTLSDKEDISGIKSDGILSYDKSTNLLTYVLYYKNEYYILDTNLTVVYKRKTIDTVTTSRINEGLLNSTQYTNTSPAQVINAKSKVDNGKLYINSKLKADNEQEDNLKKNIVIDVYDIKSGNYEESFYLPNYKSEKAIDFVKQKGMLLVAYKSKIIGYEIKDLLLQRSF